MSSRWLVEGNDLFSLQYKEKYIAVYSKKPETIRFGLSVSMTCY